MSHRVLSHTADTGIEATAPTLADLIRELAAGMFSLIADLPETAAERWHTARVEAETPEDLVVDLLSELLWLSEVEDVVFCGFRVEADQRSATVEAGGVPVADVDTTGPPIKAVTYHELAVEPRGDGWYGRVYFDV
jgi:SHS2 domain-containing protein